MRGIAFRPQGWLDRLIAARRYQQVWAWLNHHPGQHHVCDIGCGGGQLVNELIERGHSAVGVDVESGPDIIAADLNQPLPVDDSQFDLVTSLAVLEHLNNPELNLLEIYRILHPTGTLILTTPSPLAKPILEFMAFQLHLIDAREIRDHKQYFSADRLRQLLQQSGFSQVRVIHFQFGLNTLAIAQK